MAEIISKLDPSLSLEMPWPPSYILRMSSRAKSIHLRISQKNGLEIIIPKRKRTPSASELESVLNEHQTWVKRHLNRWQNEQAIKNEQALLPEKLHFPAFEKEYILNYQLSSSRQVRILSSPVCHNTLIFNGAINDSTKVILCLKRFLYKEAHLYLIPWLHQLSLKTGLFYTQTRIRSQSSLWGSCTATKNISLNAKLMFLPKEIIEYVLLHELCHIKHLNHSLRFWNLLKQYDPYYLQHRRALRHAANYLPRWIEHF